MTSDHDKRETFKFGDPIQHTIKFTEEAKRQIKEIVREVLEEMGPCRACMKTPCLCKNPTEEIAKALNAKVFIKKATYSPADRRAGRGMGVKEEMKE